MHDLKVMDIFDVQLHKGLNIEEAQIALKMDFQRIHLWATESQQLMITQRPDKLQSHINGFLESAGKFIGHGWNGSIPGILSDDSQDFDDTFTEIHLSDPEAAGLPLPSYLELDIQANDSLHEICLALADKSHLFHTDIRHSHNYNMTSLTWKKISDVDAVVRRHMAVYQRCHRQMVLLGVDAAILDQYQELEHHDMWISTTVVDPNVYRHHHEHLAWIWTMDIPKDMNTNDWMSECMSDQWEEEVELLLCETEFL
ncbi:hypothetical protein V8B97DRAFT_2024587 [Scleroderma yunnanense]